MASGATLNIDALRRGLGEIQRDLAAGVVSLRSVFESTDSTATYLYVVKALENVPGIGKVRARAILAEVGVGEHVHCGDLNDAQRRAILERSESRS